MKKSKNFFLEHYIHINIKNNKFLIYNTLTNESIVGTDSGLVQIFKKLQVDRYYEVKNNKKVEGYFKNLTKRGFLLLPKNETKKLPLIIKPELAFENLFEFNQENTDEILESLSELSIYLTPPHIPDSHLGYSYQIYDKPENTYASYDDVKKIIQNIETTKLTSINIRGNKLNKNKSFVDILDLIAIKDICIDVFVAFSSLEDTIETLQLLSKFNNLHIYIEIAHFKKLIDIQRLITKHYSNSISYILLIENLSKYNQLLNLFEQHNVKNYIIRPVYNNRNLGFFEKKVFLKEADIKNMRTNEIDILKKGVINPHFYGHLTILNNLCVNSGDISEEFGNILTDKISQIIKKAIIKESAWIKCRTNVSQCKKCIYNLLCPPISKYELEIGRNNLCHVEIIPDKN